MKLLMQCLFVGAGGFVGAIARFLVALFCGRFFGTAFPIGTMVINVSGSMLLGWLSKRVVAPDHRYLALAVGFVGAYTTFSTYMYESNSLLRDGAGIKATANLIGSLMLGLIAVKVGIWLGGK